MRRQIKTVGVFPAGMHATDMKGSWARLAPWTVTAALVLAALWLTGRLIALHHENASLRTERLLAEVAYKVGQNQLAERTLLAENMINSLRGKLRRSENLARLKVSVLIPLPGSPPTVGAVAIWDPDQQAGLLTAEHLPPIAANQDFQLWVVDPARLDPVDSGVFHSGAGGGLAIAFKPSQPVTQITAFVVTLERKGGGLKAEGPVLLRGE